MPYANRLYRWLIEPVKQQLIASGVDTLVVVPDGVLRTIPFAALHNGERYLIEEFALAVTPSLRLTAAPPLQPARANALIAGIAQSVQGFSPLPQVTSELATIHDRVGGTVLSNRDYTKQKLRSALAESDYTVIHMATHSVVGATPADSFLLTYDGKLTMTDLDYLLRIGEFRNRQVELLTLSACETAIGDERAALGLAGIAVKSGAKSVVASLWLVDDAATAQLMDSFYRSLDLRGEGAASKAKALRAAQLSMLGDPATAHPAKWAAFMMIGNWQ
jgi:CHAT domain-containing protein